MPWYKGNLHCHSTKSDGRSAPDCVAKYYKEIGYDFLGISDHNKYTPIETYAEDAGILGIPCCEYTGQENCHVVAAGVTENVAPDLGSKDIWERGKPDITLAEKISGNENMKKVLILQDGINKTLLAGGVPIICHPFWRWTYSSKEVMQLENCTHFEICNASPDCNSFPLPGKSYADEMWDKLLSAGLRIIGIASDDAHLHEGVYHTRAAVGGTGYNMVKASSLTKENILSAIKQGHCYATTGIILSGYKVFADKIMIEVDVQQEEKTQIQFFGQDGVELQSEYGSVSEYRFNGDEKYVRCRIASTAGVWAWTQPVFMDDIRSAIEWTGGDKGEG